MNPKGSRLWIACAWGSLAASLILAAERPAFASASNMLLGIEGLASFETAAGAPMDIETSRSSRPKGAYDDKLVSRIQKALADQGFYVGVIDGQYGPRTEAAIRAYQQSADLPVDGLPSETLADDLETGGKVRKLLGRLEESRKKSTDEAREALLANPETRALIEGARLQDAKPHDVEACMTDPTPRCLLTEAAIKARDIEKPEMRDWALGEILSAQAKAGLAADALATTRRIHDPRLIVVALREIAKAQAEAGHTEDALAAVDIIPDLVQQVEAYVSIAEVQSNKGDVKAAAETAVHMLDYLRRIESPLTKVVFRTRIAALLHRSGQNDLAKDNIKAAETLAPTIVNTVERNEAIRYVAAAYAEIGQPATALEILKTADGNGTEPSVLIAAATKMAQTGAANEALLTADSIEAVRYRALVLARIAAYQAGGGDLDSARATLAKAVEDAKKITFPFAKAYAFSRIALAFNDVAISAGNDETLLTQAEQTADQIKDDRLKAHILWTIADERRRSGLQDGTEKAQALADKATADIMSPFSRVWMLCDIADDRSRKGEMDGAWAVFNTALDEAKTITNPWGRARALGKVASTMTSLADLVALASR